MVKFAIALLAVLGSFWMLNAFLPSVMSSTFHVASVPISWGIVVLGGVFYLAMRRKGK